jgi:Excalibur calcium-binding domain
MDADMTTGLRLSSEPFRINAPRVFVILPGVGLRPLTRGNTMGAVNPQTPDRKRPMTGRRKLLLGFVAASLVFCGLAAIGAAFGDPDRTGPTPTTTTARSTPGGGVGVVTPVAPPVPKPPVVATTTPKPKPKPSTRTTTAPRTDPRFATCKEAKAHGYGPYHVGEIEYDWYIDADSDGIVCE